MAAKKNKLVEGFEAIIDSGDLDAFKAVFDKCEITATRGGGKDKCNALSYKNLTPAHIQFLIDNGLDVNSDCGFGFPAVAYQADNKENLKCLIDNGADVNCVVVMFRGTALVKACFELNSTAVKNLLEAGASSDVPGFLGETLINTVLSRGDFSVIPLVLDISKMLLESGCKADEKSRNHVTKIGENFEYYRSGISTDEAGKLEKALSELYSLFDVSPVPRSKTYENISQIKSEVAGWQKQYNELWKLLVPASGKAKTIQGEALRIIGGASYEILDNGGLNWDDDYRKMMAFLPELLRAKSDAFEKEKLDEAVLLSGSISSNSDEKKLNRLTELVVEWVLANPELIPLGKVDYNR